MELVTMKCENGIYFGRRSSDYRGQRSRIDIKSLRFNAVS